VQVCTAAMHYGFKIVDDMIDGLANWMDGKGYARIEDFRGKAVPNVTDWQFLNMNFKTIAKIDQELCIKCGLCHIACEDTSHQSIRALKNGAGRRYEVIEAECVGCNLCMHVCPVPDCITMQPVDTGRPYMNWTQHPANPMRKAAE
jgi:dihydropyrimidine dehydrogenase (NAD+) subunit PreA